MRLSIIIVNWKSTEYLRGCLKALFRHLDDLEWEVIVVDNASEDGCEAMLMREFPRVTLLKAAENLGFARANNLGVKSCHGEILLFLNPDTEVADDSLQRMAAWLETHPRVGVVGARLLNSDKSPQQTSVQAFPTLRNQFLDSEFLRRRFPRSRMWGTHPLCAARRGAFVVDAVSGACLMARREAFEAAGRFSEEYFMYADDLELCYRVRQAGYAVVCLTNCTMTHFGGRSSAQQGAWFADVAQRNAMARFFRRTRGPGVEACYRILTGISALIRLSVAGALLLFARQEQQRKRARMIWVKWRVLLQWGLSRRPRRATTQNLSHA